MTLLHEEITLEINGIELNAAIQYNFTPGIKERIAPDPNDSWPAEADEYELLYLYIQHDDKSVSDATFLIKEIEESLIEDLVRIHEST